MISYRVINHLFTGSSESEGHGRWQLGVCLRYFSVCFLEARRRPHIGSLSLWSRGQGLKTSSRFAYRRLEPVPELVGGCAALWCRATPGGECPGRWSVGGGGDTDRDGYGPRHRMVLSPLTLTAPPPPPSPTGSSLFLLSARTGLREAA